jgi:hypothetical protein
VKTQAADLQEHAIKTEPSRMSTFERELRALVAEKYPNPTRKEPAWLEKEIAKRVPEHAQEAARRAELYERQLCASPSPQNVSRSAGRGLEQGEVGSGDSKEPYRFIEGL